MIAEKRGNSTHLHVHFQFTRPFVLNDPPDLFSSSFLSSSTSTSSMGSGLLGKPKIASPMAQRAAQLNAGGKQAIICGTGPKRPEAFRREVQRQENERRHEQTIMDRLLSLQADSRNRSIEAASVLSNSKDQEVNQGAKQLHGSLRFIGVEDGRFRATVFTEETVRLFRFISTSKEEYPIVFDATGQSRRPVPWMLAIYSGSLPEIDTPLPLLFHIKQMTRESDKGRFDQYDLFEANQLMMAAMHRLFGRAYYPLLLSCDDDPAAQACHKKMNATYNPGKESVAYCDSRHAVAAVSRHFKSSEHKEEIVDLVCKWVASTSSTSAENIANMFGELDLNPTDRRYLNRLLNNCEKYVHAYSKNGHKDHRTQMIEALIRNIKEIIRDLGRNADFADIVTILVELFESYVLRFFEELGGIHAGFNVEEASKNKVLKTQVNFDKRKLRTIRHKYKAFNSQKRKHKDGDDEEGEEYNDSEEEDDDDGDDFAMKYSIWSSRRRKRQNWYGDDKRRGKKKQPRVLPVSLGGILNVTKTDCHHNASLQLLVNSPLCDIIASLPLRAVDPNAGPHHECVSLLVEICTAKKSEFKDFDYVKTRELLRAIAKFSRTPHDRGQQDASETLNYILDALLTWITEIGLMLVPEEGGPGIPGEDLLCSVIRQSKVCMVHGVAMDGELTPLVVQPIPLNQNANSLGGFIELAQAEEINEYVRHDCDQCGPGAVGAITRVEEVVSSPIRIYTLKRFETDENGGPLKLNIPVQFEVDLQNRSLSGAITHYSAGNSAKTGHYMAIVQEKRDGNVVYSTYNDDKVIRNDTKGASSIVSNGYIYMYCNPAFFEKKYVPSFNFRAPLPDPMDGATAFHWEDRILLRTQLERTGIFELNPDRDKVSTPQSDTVTVESIRQGWFPTHAVDYMCKFLLEGFEDAEFISSELYRHLVSTTRRAATRLRANGGIENKYLNIKSKNHLLINVNVNDNHWRFYSWNRTDSTLTIYDHFVPIKSEDGDVKYIRSLINNTLDMDIRNVVHITTPPQPNNSDCGPIIVGHAMEYMANLKGNKAVEFRPEHALWVRYVCLLAFSNTRVACTLLKRLLGC